MSTTSTPAPLGAPVAAAPVARGPILVAATGDDGTAAIETAARLAARDGRAVAVVSAVELPPATPGLDGSLLVPDLEAYADMQRARVRRQLGAVGDVARTWTVEVVADEPARAIADAARARRASLLVMGTGRYDLPARMLGEVAVRAARYAPCPVLLVGRVTTALMREAPCAVLVTPEPTLAERDALQRALWGTSESRARGEWGELLEAFTRRNAGRRARLEVDDRALGARTQETGWAFLGAAYDRHDHRVALMFGGAGDATAHLTRSIERVSSVAVLTGPDGRDTALRITHGTAQTLLTFLP